MKNGHSAAVMHWWPVLLLSGMHAHVHIWQGAATCCVNQRITVWFQIIIPLRNNPISLVH